jgi:hypothetical protein
MKKLLTTILLLFSLSAYTAEIETIQREMYVIGRFILYREADGYRASCGGQLSRLHSNSINAINELS